MSIGRIRVIAAEGVAFIEAAMSPEGELLPDGTWRLPAWTSAAAVEEHTWPWIVLNKGILDSFLERRLDKETLAEAATGDATWPATSEVVVGVIEEYSLAFAVETVDESHVRSALIGSIDAPLPFRTSDEYSRVQGLTWMLGAGAIGSYAAEMLPNWGFTRLAVIDRDILTSENVVLHTCGPNAIGRSKAKAVADGIEQRFNTVTTVGLKTDIRQAAAELRDMLQEAPLMFVAVDDPGVRQLCNHLAVAAGVPAVFAALFHRGTVAEVVAYQPGGPCLNCVRLAVPMDPPRSQRASPSNYRTGLRSEVQMTAAFATRTAAALIHGPGEDLPELPGAAAYLSGTTTTALPSPWRFDVPGQVNWLELPADPTCRVCRGGSPGHTDEALLEVRRLLGLDNG